MGKDNCKTRPETFMFGDWVRLILENWRYVSVLLHVPHVPAVDQGCSMSAARATCTYKSCQKYLELIKPQGSGQRSAYVLIPARFDNAKVMLCKQSCLFCPVHWGAIFLFFWKLHDQSLKHIYLWWSRILRFLIIFSCYPFLCKSNISTDCIIFLIMTSMCCSKTGCWSCHRLWFGHPHLCKLYDTSIQNSHSSE